MFLFSRFLPVLLLSFTLPAWGNLDKGKEVIGVLECIVFQASHKPFSASNPPQGEVLNKLKAASSESFLYFSELGRDRQSIYRSYKNWLRPLKPSEALLLSFEARGQRGRGMALDIQLWQKKKKIIQSNLVLTPRKPLIIVGPKIEKDRTFLVISLH